MNDLAVVALTPHGRELGQRIVAALGRGTVFSAEGGARPQLAELFQAGRPLICVMALGIVVRIIGPLAQDKETDPPVVVVDEAGQFAISVLGGHVAGANELAKEVANGLGAVVVITTASDALGVPPVDLIGRDWGWKIERRENLKRVAAAVVRGETIGVYQDIGRRDWWSVFGEWPRSFQWIKVWPPKGYWAAVLAITDLQLAGLDLYPGLSYRPPTLVLGIGCKRGVSCAALEEMFQHVCRAQGFSPLSLGSVATISLKADEPGLLEFTAVHHVPLRIFSPEEIAAVPDLPSPSQQVKDKIGVWGVAEPAALLAANTDRLVMRKERGPGITMALARRENV